MRNTLKITTPTDLEIVMTRAFNAPRKLVWEAMTRPERIKRWLFLPPGWEMAACEDDVRVGGRFRWAWNGPDGKPGMAMNGVYREVVPLQRMVRTETLEFGCVMPGGAEQIASVELTDTPGGNTLLTLRVKYPSKQARDAALASGMEHGVATGYDQLEEQLLAGATN